MKYPGATIGKCACYDGYTCANCDKTGMCSSAAKHNLLLHYVKVVCAGVECSKAAGGGSCKDDYDCTYLGGGITAGKCEKGRCSCFRGYTCPYCSSFGAYALPAPFPCTDIDWPSRLFVCVGAGNECLGSAGGATCTQDTECGTVPGARAGGKCKSGKCQCASGNTCAHCEALGIVVDAMYDCVSVWLMMCTVQVRTVDPRKEVAFAAPMLTVVQTHSHHTASV